VDRLVTSPPIALPRQARGRLLDPAALAGALASALMGALVVTAVYGAHVLPPGSTAWMLTGTIGPDPVQYWLGYTNFKSAPWSWPPGLNPAWGLELASSIYYADSIPLLAFVFKALHPLVEVPQYWGLWLHACGALQGVFAWKLIGLATRDPLARLSGAALFVIQPLLLNRLGGHFALGAQFLLLAGLYLCLTRGEGARRVLAWAGLVLAASLIHSYLLPMVFCLWLADWLARALATRRALPIGVEALLVPCVVLAGLWAAGAFVLSGGIGGAASRYGEMQLDLLAPFDPSFWGGILPKLPDPGHPEVGSSYPGLGVLLLLAVGAIAWWRRPLRGLLARWPLMLALGAMLAFAITHRPSIGGMQVTLFTLPPALEEIASALRCSERFFFPLLYALMAGATAALAHAIGGRRTGLVLAVLVLVQVIDLQPGFARLRHYFPTEGPAVAPLRLKDPFWESAALRYTRIRVTPNGNLARHWEEVAVFAATKGLETDAVYLARIDPAQVAALDAKVAAQLSAGRYEPRTLYVLGDEAMLARARLGMNQAADLLLHVDGMWVLAPGWHHTR
jgi:hypothetical protein